MRPQIEALKHHAEFGADPVDLPAVGGLGAPVAALAHLDRLARDGDHALSGVSRRLMQRRKVLLPEPEEPRIEMTSPSLAVSEMPFSTSNWPKLLRIDGESRRRGGHGALRLLQLGLGRKCGDRRSSARKPAPRM